MPDARQLPLPVASHDEAVALFRYGLIADLLHLPPGHRRLQVQLREKADREYDIPGSSRRGSDRSDPSGHCTVTRASPHNFLATITGRRAPWSGWKGCVI